MTRFNIGGVPEHYNLPFYLLHETQALRPEGIDIHWKEYSTGTGAMLQGLREGELDIAILLTEGIITDQHSGNTAAVFAHYVASPLVWGVHTHSSHAFPSAAPVTEHTRFAISRPKSGSHLMAYLYAQQFGISLSDEQFVIVNNMPGAAVAMAEGRADLFLWEKFTTKPLVDNGTFHRINEIPTPWAPFVLVARKEVIRDHQAELNLLIDWLSNKTKHLKRHPQQSIEVIAKRFKQRPEDVSQWFERVRWDVKPVQDFAALEKVEQTLIDLNIIQPTPAMVLS